MTKMPPYRLEYSRFEGNDSFKQAEYVDAPYDDLEILRRWVINFVNAALSNGPLFYLQMRILDKDKEIFRYGNRASPKKQ